MADKAYERPEHEYDRHRHAELTRAKALREAAAKLGKEFPGRANQLLNEAKVIDGEEVKLFAIPEAKPEVSDGQHD